jgi:hypothetical protein
MAAVSGSSTSRARSSPGEDFDGDCDGEVDDGHNGGWCLHGRKSHHHRRVVTIAVQKMMESAARAKPLRVGMRASRA